MFPVCYSEHQSTFLGLSAALKSVLVVWGLYVVGPPALVARVSLRRSGIVVLERDAAIQRVQVAVFRVLHFCADHSSGVRCPRLICLLLTCRLPRQNPPGHLPRRSFGILRRLVSVSGHPLGGTVAPLVSVFFSRPLA